MAVDDVSFASNDTSQKTPITQFKEKTNRYTNRYSVFGNEQTRVKKRKQKLEKDTQSFL